MQKFTKVANLSVRRTSTTSSSTAKMTLSLRDFNGSGTGLFNYRHFSKISILNDTLQRENKEYSSLVGDHSLRQVFDKPQKSVENYDGENWSEGLCSPQTKNSGRFLNIDSDSVLNFSLASAPKLNNVNESAQLFTPPVLGNSNKFNLDELNAHISLILEEFAQAKVGETFIAKLGLRFIPQTVKLNQALTRFDNDPKGKATTKCVVKFVELCNKLIEDIWLPNMRDYVTVMKAAVQYLDKFSNQYTKVEMKSPLGSELGRVVFQWSMLNYFPTVLVKSLNFKVLFGDRQFASQQDEKRVLQEEVSKIIFVTMALEVSKSFIKIMNILEELDACKFFDSRVVRQVMTMLLDCTVESHTGEIMIGVDQVVKTWITEKTKTESHCKASFHQCVRGILYDYKLRFHNEISMYSFSSENKEQVAELMFDKYDLGKIFVEEILKYTQPEMPKLSQGNSIGWLTIFNDELEPVSSISDESLSSAIQPPTLRSLEPPTDLIVGPSSTRIALTQSTKRAAVKGWAHDNKVKISREFNKIREKFHGFFQFHRRPSIITSVRYYNAVASLQSHRVPFPGDTTTVREEQRANVEKLTRKLYRKEKRGKRKRDGFKVIFS